MAGRPTRHVQGLDDGVPDALAADGRVHAHSLEFGGRVVQPPHRPAADRHGVEIGNHERAVAAPTCPPVSEKCMAPGSGNAAFSSAFSAAISWAASGGASVRISTVPCAGNRSTDGRLALNAECRGGEVAGGVRLGANRCHAEVGTTVRRHLMCRPLARRARRHSRAPSMKGS
jgi:hypothetical protein